MSEARHRDLARPHVSVIITTYNRQHFVDDAIESVFAQTFTDYELLVVDDGSTDGTPEYVEKIYGDRLRVLRTANGGPSAARNFGAEAARGELLAFLDDDDLYLPEKLAAQVALFRTEGESVGIIGGATQFVSETLAPLGNPQFGQPEVSHEQCCVKPSIPGIFSSVMVRTSVWREVGGMDLELRRAQDMDFVIRASKRYRVMNVPQVVVRTRVHDAPRANVDLDVILRCRRIILARIDDPLVRRRARAWLYFTLSRRCWLAGERGRAIGWWIRSFVTWPLRTAQGAERIRGTARLIVGDRA